jgi:hypothetical protein
MRPTIEPQPNEPFDRHASPKRDAAPGSDQDREAGEADSPGEIIRIGGTISPKDLFSANKLTHQEKPSDAIVVVAMFLLVSLGICVGAVVTRESGLLFLAAMFLVVAIGLGFSAFRSVRRLDQDWRQQRGIFRPQRIEITEEGIGQQMEDRSAAYRWNAFSKYAASKRVIILHFDPPDGWFMHSMRGYLVIPREFFPSDADWHRFLQLVQRKLPKRYRERKPW